MSNKGKYNRYYFCKKFNKNSIVLISGKDRYYTFGRDADILKYISFNMKYNVCSLKYLDKCKINYIVIENLNIVENKKFDNNSYMLINKMEYLSRILKKIKSYEFIFDDDIMSNLDSTDSTNFES